MKRIGLIFFSIVTISGMALLLNWQKTVNLYHVITLFEENVIVDNFSRIPEIFPTRDIPKSNSITPLHSQPQELPSEFTFNNENYSVDSFLERTNTTALLVMNNDHITFENYYQGTKETDLRISWSTAKSMLSALFGIAVAEGHIESINDPVTDYVPELFDSGYDGVTIKNVLQMSSGVAFDEDYGKFNSDINRLGRIMAIGGSFDEFAATLVAEKKQGTFMHYVSIDTHVLGMVLRKATNRDFIDYFNEKLWSKMGMESNASYIVDSLNEPMVLGGLNIRTRDFARFGKLYLNNGKWQGNQLVPEDWVKASVTPDASHLMPGERDNSDISLGYGYQWWIPVDADQEFMAIGIYDQFIYVNQKYGVVIVKNSANRQFMDNDFESMFKTVEFFRTVAKSLDKNHSKNKEQSGLAAVNQ